MSWIAVVAGFIAGGFLSFSRFPLTGALTGALLGYLIQRTLKLGRRVGRLEERLHRMRETGAAPPREESTAAPLPADPAGGRRPEADLAGARRGRGGLPPRRAGAAGPRASPPPWQKIALWCVLVVSVALIGWMAMSLLRQLREREGA